MLKLAVHLLCQQNTVNGETRYANGAPVSMYIKNKIKVSNSFINLEDHISILGTEINDNKLKLDRHINKIY